MTIFDNIVQNTSVNKINAFLKKHNYPPVHSAPEAKRALIKLAKKGDSSLYDITLLHPDRDLILRAEKDTYLSAGGNNKCYVCGFNGEEGEEKAQTFRNITDYFNKNAGTLMMIALGIGILSLVAKGKT